jgi:nicotinate (nicotinamide) nucleotide adenylyltransferase
MGTRLGVMGGTFDPIHVGHLVTAEEALHQFALDEVVFVPTGRPWMKEHDVVASAEDRYAMTAIGIEPEPRFHVSRLEVDRGGATYTVDTLRALRDEVPGAELFFITGRRRDARDHAMEGAPDHLRPRALHRGDAAGLRRRGVGRACPTSR